MCISAFEMLLLKHTRRYLQLESIYFIYRILTSTDDMSIALELYYY